MKVASLLPLTRPLGDLSPQERGGSHVLMGLNIGQGERWDWDSCFANWLWIASLPLAMTIRNCCAMLFALDPRSSPG
jgi:uncharacterized membrane-anchored protein